MPKEDDTIIFEPPSEGGMISRVPRAAYRIQLRGRANCFLVINSIRYCLLDVSSTGASVAFEGELKFNINDKLHNCDLIIGDNNYENLEGTVVYYIPGSDNSWVCGVRFDRMGADTQRKLDASLGRLRTEVLNEQQTLSSWS